MKQLRIIFILFIINWNSLNAQSSIIYKGEKINELDQNNSKSGEWKLYGENKNILITCQMSEGNFVSNINYYKDSKLIASQTTDDVINIYKGADTIKAKFDYREDKSTTMVDLKGNELDSETIRYFTQAAEVMPMFYGGQQELINFISKNINFKNSKGHKGKVRVKFVVNGNGEIQDIEIVDSEDTALNEEAIRIIKILPRWQPGFQRGHFVKASFTIPLVFP